MECFKQQVQVRGDEPFLGHRPRIGTDEAGKPLFGDYAWETWRQVDQITENLANGFISLNLAPEVEGEGKMWRFMGVWMQNKPEWTKTELACMHYKMTTVGFYDAMGVS